MPESSSPPTRWQQTVIGPRWTTYADRFAEMYADGTDLDGEARFVDALAARGSTILDAGCGTGRVAAALRRMGHHTIGADRDGGLVGIGQRRYPGVPLIAEDLLDLTPELLTAGGGPPEFDVIVLPGNVMVYLAPGTERDVLSVLAGLLKPGGRIVAGFATDREYTVRDLDADGAEVGLVMEHRFATWHLDPYEPESGWAVTVLRGPGQMPSNPEAQADATVAREPGPAALD